MTVTPLLRFLPDALSIMRIALAPTGLLVAWQGHRAVWLAILVAALLSDFLDGYLARRFELGSARGAQLDSFADLATYFCAPLAVWWLWPEVVAREALWFGAMVAAFVTPLVVGWLRWRRFPSYHTRGAKLNAVLLPVASIVLLLGGPPWPFRAVVIFLVLIVLEELAITAVLPAWQTNIKSLRHALTIRRAAKRDGK